MHTNLRGDTKNECPMFINIGALDWSSSSDLATTAGHQANGGHQQ
jgi:hypothetical protein